MTGCRSWSLPESSAGGEALRASDGVRLHLHEWAPSGPASAALLLLHGVGEHGGRYDRLGRKLARRGVHTLVADHRGHGLSEGHPGHVDRWARYIEDGLELLGRLEQRVPGVPCFVFGHSMGSLICLELAMRSDTRGRVRGWIVSGAGIEPTGVAKPHLVAIARLLSGVLPRFRLDLGIEGPDLSHDRAVVERYGNDPLIRRRATVRWGAEALSSIDRIKAEPARVDGPILILHGGDDPLSRAEGSRWLAERVGGDPTLRIYEGCLHEPHNDPEYASAADDIADWIEAHA